MKTTWILIANACQARLFEAEKTYRQMRLITEFSHPESREKVTDLVIDNRGRYHDTKSSPAGVYDVPTNPKEVEAERFAHELAKKLDTGRTHNEYVNLVLIAPSHFQGLLNKCCKNQVKERIINTIDKDYTKLKQPQLLKYLDGKLKYPLLRAA